MNANEKTKIHNLINGLDNENKVANIELAILKAKAKDTIDTTANLSDLEKNTFKTKIEGAKNSNEISMIIREAEKIAILILEKLKLKQKLIKFLIQNKIKQLLINLLWH
ncbi:hypothetical protein NW062_01510 [Mycoplasmopsis cynos]|nr:hypothetical protein NW062_01510 [Mycoplasmopsis cynos]